ncbi:PEP-CTERM sorting domain-containing protein [Microcystis aeruginosa]|uniref:PEP-CTERM sorting domain-containing protein n=1 Tax=Microcystis aeruginosa TaxID=1126 RepID=UPI00232DB847|nr:PEP-CTERM sorting domain-containing protein [Microcystis aeruginosa]MDB9411533.1 PEP-CTERM sorting domain-containing protein [Microcystis aeruginosa CS-567/02]
MNTTTTLKSLSGVVFTGAVSAIAKLTALPVRSCSLKPISDFLGTTIGMATAVTLGTVISLPAQATTLFSQTNIVTNPGAGFNGSDVSQASAAVNTAGQAATSNFRLAQSFTISNAGLWAIDTVSVMAYMTSTYGFPPTSPFTGISVNIWDNAPGLAGSNILGSSTNLLSTNWTGVYRTFNGVLNNAQRPVMNIAANFSGSGLTLAPGTYWADYQLTGLSPTGGTTGFTPFLMTTSGGNPVTVNGNAQQFNNSAAPNAWITISNGTPAQGVSLPLTVTGQKVPEPSTVLGLGLLGFGALVLKAKARQR